MVRAGGRRAGSGVSRDRWAGSRRGDGGWRPRGGRRGAAVPTDGEVETGGTEEDEELWRRRMLTSRGR